MLSTSPRRHARCPTACDSCRVKKIRCNGEQPCTNCVDYREKCVYKARHRQGKKKIKQGLRPFDKRAWCNETHLSIARKIAMQPEQEESIVESIDAPPTMSSNLPFQGTNTSYEGVGRAPTASALIPSYNDEQIPIEPFQTQSPIHQPSIILPPPPNISPGRPPARIQLPATPSLSLTTNIEDDDGSCVLPPEEEMSYEYHGPGSFLAICSKSSIEWVCQKTGTRTFAKSARKMALDICRRLKLDQIIYRTQEPDPDAETAWSYVKTYFDECTETAFGVIQRPNFEARLRSQFKQGQLATADQDPAWYALRNIVYAGGCRQLSGKSAFNGFRFDEGLAWKFFSNAFSVYQELLYCRTNLLAVQALVAMSFYVEGIGTPSLEYMLCVSALKLAESKGLHRRPSNAWNLSESAVQYRSNLWWAIYIYERNIAFRSGRPLSIEDDEITCQIPTMRPEGDLGNQEFFIVSVTQAQLFSLIIKRLKTLKNSKPSLQDVTGTISDLHAATEQWYASVPESLKLNLATGRFSEAIHPVQGVFSLFAYYGCLLAIHSVLVHPWNAVPLDYSQCDKEELQRYVLNSTEIVVEASRNIIRNLKHVRINPSAPKSMVYVLPLQAMVSLFVHLLQYPDRSTVDSDIALMHNASGHLGYVEYACADLEFPFAREMTNLACMTVSMAQRPSGLLKGPVLVEDQQRCEAYPAERPLQGSIAAPDLPILDSSLMFNMTDLDDERWGTLLWWPDSNNDLAAGITDSPEHQTHFDISG